MKTATTERGDIRFAFALGAILLVQAVAGLWHITDPFIDGSQHYNWGPPFWLMRAHDINAVGLPATYFGLKDYASHPELIGPVISLWTQAAGYSEASVRLLSLALTILATIILVLAVREYVGNKLALLAGLAFAALPLIYIFGKKLDQEALVLVFLTLALRGLGRLQHERPWSIALLFAGGLGMMLSDWSGAVFAFAIGVLCVWSIGYRTPRAVRGTFAIWGGAALGLALFMVQSYLQSGAHGIGDYAQSYIDVWQYRAGLGSVHITPFVWLGKQYLFARINYTIPALLAGICGLWLGMRGGSDDGAGVRRLAQAGIAILIASIAYMAVVPQASAIHVYFQYFLSIPVAIGLVLFVRFLATWWRASHAEQTTRYLGAVLVLALAANTAYTYVELLSSQYGDASDIALLRSLKALPADKTVVAADTDQYVRDWFGNPNVMYYADRAITAYSFDDGIPPSDYLIVRKEVAPEIIAQIKAGAAGPSTASADTSCAKTFCLLHLR